MPLFKEKKNSLVMLKSKPISKEKELQTIIENNLLQVFEMYFLATEYTTTFGGRIDTLAVDTSGCPVIIEYKRNRNDNVINQSLSYLKWLQSQKQEFFEMLTQKNLEPQVAKHIKLDWKNPRVVCVAESFSKFDIDTVEVVPIRIELYKYKFYEDKILNIDPISVKESSKKNESIESKPITEYSLETHIKKGNQIIQKIFLELKSRILELDDDIEERVTSLYIAYRLSKSFVEIHITQKKLCLYLRPIDYKETNCAVEKISDGYNWTMNKRTYISTLE